MKNISINNKLSVCFSLSLLLGATSLSHASTESWTCNTLNPSMSKPYDQFFVTLDTQKKTGSIEYIRYAFWGSEEFRASVQKATLDSKGLYVECDGDGDAGYLSASFKTKGPQKGKLIGSMNFPNDVADGSGEIIYTMDTEIKVICNKQ